MELKQYLKMSQQLVMTPQLQQAIKLLQLSRIELQESISQELLENPVLETNETAEARDASDVAQSIENEVVGPAEEVRAVDEPSMDWEQFVENYNQYSYSPGSGSVRYGDDDMPTLEQTLASHESLHDHLDWQLNVTQFTDEERLAAERIIGNITEDGYLNGDMLAPIAAELGMEEDEVEAVLEVIQLFDPVGVGARDLRECLLVQAKHFYPRDDVVHGIIADHLENLEKRNVQVVLKALDIDVVDLGAAAQVINTLEPRPGRSFTTVDTHYITPDVYIHKMGEEYVVVLNEDGMPKLRISNFYENRIKGKKASGDEKTFIQDKFKSAVWLIRSIHQRQNTIRKVTESIVRFQREFLDRGVAFLRPLILRDVADDVGMHESTISRVTTNKYVHTPQGIFELKYFFNSRITSDSGADVASEAVKQQIKGMIAKESKNKPLSDQKICDILSDEGMQIARRTVAKYREAMNIPPSSKRKKLF